MIDFIENRESGLSVRNKLNTGIDQINILWSGTQSGTNFGGGGSGGSNYLDDTAQTTAWKAYVEATGATWTVDEAEILNQFITQVDASGYLSKLLYVAPMLGSNIYAAAAPLVDTIAVGPLWLNNGLGTGNYIRNSGVIFDENRNFIAPFNPSTEPTALGFGGLMIDKNVNGVYMFGFINNANTRSWNIVVSKGSPLSRFTWGSSNSDAALENPSPVDHTFYYGQGPSTISRSLYRNGLLVGSNTTSSTPAGTNDDFYRVGGQAFNGAELPFSGTLGIALFTDGSLTDGEVAHLNTVVNQYFETGRKALTNTDTMANPMLARGDLIVGGLNGTPERLGSGNGGQVLGRSGDWLAWVDQSGGGGGGFTNPMIASGDLILGGNAGDPARLPIGSDGQVLTVNGTTLSWADSAGGGSSPLITLTGKYYTEPKLVARCTDANYNFNGASDTWIHVNVFTGVEYSGQGFSYDVNSGIFHVEESGWYDITASWVSYINNVTYERGIRMADSGNTTVYQVAQGYGRSANYDSLHLRTYFTGGENFTFFGRKGTAANSLIFNAPNGGLRVDKLVEAETYSLTAPYQVVYAYNPTTSGIPNPNLAFRDIGFTGIITNYANTYNTGNSTITIQSDGLYHIDCQVRLENTPAGGRYVLQTQVNGNRIDIYDVDNSSQTAPTFKNSIMHQFYSGDVIEHSLLSDTASTLDMQGGSGTSYLKLHKLADL